MPQLVKHLVTGKVGIIGVDPYQICGLGEMIVSFSKATDREPYLGHGYPEEDFTLVTEDQVSRYYRRKYGVKTTAQKKREEAERWERDCQLGWLNRMYA